VALCGVAQVMASLLCVVVVWGFDGRSMGPVLSDVRMSLVWCGIVCRCSLSVCVSTAVRGGVPGRASSLAHTQFLACSAVVELASKIGLYPVHSVCILSMAAAVAASYLRINVVGFSQ
jgi:hypothetical protein